jgi:hypothetical protein
MDCEKHNYPEIYDVYSKALTSAYFMARYSPLNYTDTVKTAVDLALEEKQTFDGIAEVNKSDTEFTIATLSKN